jgi:hypothetical protein
MSKRVGDAAFAKMDKCNSELFSLTYGAIVTQLLKDYEEVDATNAQLEKMYDLRQLNHAHALSRPPALRLQALLLPSPLSAVAHTAKMLFYAGVCVCVHARARVWHRVAWQGLQHWGETDR